MNARDEIFRELEYVTHKYLASEQSFPLWETIYAAFIAGLLVAFFSTENTFFARVFICISGSIFSLQWARIVARNYLYSLGRAERMDELARFLGKDVVLKYGQKVRVFPDPIIEAEFRRKKQTWWSRTDSWTLRKQLPRQILALWFVLLLYTVYLLLFP